MAYSHNIRIDNIPVTDYCAKIICLSIRGVSYDEIGKIYKHTSGIIRNEVSRHYGLFDSPHCIQSLVFHALQNGFDYNGRVNGQLIFEPYELQRLQQFVPRLARYRQLELQFK